MGNETSKTLKIFTDAERNILLGTGIDIGCGSDPVSNSCLRFDLDAGDANRIGRYVDKTFDYVYSSHCLEHMDDPRKAVEDWWSLVKDGGHMFLIVPDEDLYEQGVFPSRFNGSHKHTFTIGKNKSWSNKSINLFQLVASLPDARIVKLELQDNNYDRRLWNDGATNVRKGIIIRGLVKIYKKARKYGLRPRCLEELLKYHLPPTDQTLRNDVVAQICCIAKKSSSVHE